MKSILNDPKLEKLITLVEESTRSSKEGVKRFIEPAQGTTSRAVSKRHHIIFGRRGLESPACFERRPLTLRSTEGRLPMLI